MPDAAQQAREPEKSAWERARSAPWVFSTYFAEGLPFAIVRQLSSEFLTSMGVSPKEIGATSLYGLAWNAKLLWSPLVDRHGTIRRWLLVTEGLLALLVLVLAWPAGRGETGVVWRVLVAVAFLAATHDVAIDGHYLEALDKDSQARFSGLRVAAYRVALLAGKGLLVLAGALQGLGWDRAIAWRATFAAAGLGLALLVVTHAIVLPKSAARLPRDAASPSYVDAFVSFSKQPKIAASLAFIIAYKAGDSLMFAMNAPFLKSLGFGDLLRGTVGTVGVFASIGGSIAGGAFIAKRGLARTLGPIAVAQSLAILLYVGVALLRPGMALVGVAAVLEQLAGGIGDSALAVFLLRRCSRDHKAAHFAIGSALMSVASTAAGVSSGFLLTRVGYPAFFAIAFVVSLPGVILTRFVPKE